MKAHRLDAIDIRILETIQKDGRITKLALAAQVGLSPTPCWVRLRRLEKAGIVTGYHARVALRAVAPGHLRRPGLRLTVDTPEDLSFVRAVLAATGSSPMPPLADVIRVADELLVKSATRTQSRQGA